MALVVRGNAVATQAELQAKHREEIERKREHHGEHVRSYEAVARFYLGKGEYKGDGFVEYKIRCAVGRRLKLLQKGTEEQRDALKEQLRAEGAKKAKDVVAKGKLRDVAVEKRTMLHADFDSELQNCIAKHALVRRDAESVFLNRNGAIAVSWNADREYMHRRETRDKKASESLKEWDPVTKLFANFQRPNGTEIPIPEYISSNLVKWSRTSKGQAGKSGYTSLLLKAKNGHSAGARTPPAMRPIFGNSCRRNTKPVAWVPVCKKLIKKLAPAFASWLKWKDFTSGEYVEIKERYRSAVRLHAAAMNLVHAKKDNPRTNGRGSADNGKWRETTLCSEELVLPDDEATSEDHLVHEELKALQQIWSRFGFVLAAECDATLDWQNEIIADMLCTEAMVTSYNVAYGQPSDLSFRDVVEDVNSYAPAEMLRAIKEGAFKGVTPQYVEASSVKPPCQVYIVNGQVHRVYPYAAMLDADTLQLKVCFSIMRMCYPDVYSRVSYKLKHWHYLGMTGGGFCDVNAIERRQNTDDFVFGNAGPHGSLALAEHPPPKFNDHLLERKQWRFRRTVGDECGLPPTSTAYPLLLECKWPGTTGDETRLICTNGAFYAEQSPSCWAKLPQNKDGDWQRPCDDELTTR